MEKEKIGAILSVVLTAVIALLAIFGYQVVVVNPSLATITAEVGVLRAELSTFRVSAVQSAGGGCPCGAATP